MFEKRTYHWFLSHIKTNILHNDTKSVANRIIGFFVCWYKLILNSI